MIQNFNLNDSFDPEFLETPTSEKPNKFINSILLFEKGSTFNTDDNKQNNVKVEFVEVDKIKPIYINDKKNLDDYPNHKKLLNKKRKKNNDNKKVHTKRGRKNTKNETSTKVHNNLSPDNIISKIKTKIMELCRLILNIILCLVTDDQIIEEKIKKVLYEKTKGLKTEKELKFWDQDLKTLFSNDISRKYVKTPKNANRIFIENTLKNNPSDTILFVLSLTFGEWFDIFTYRKNLRDFENSFPNANFELIENNFIYANYLYNEIKMNKDNTEKYSDQFLYYLHNYRAYYENRKGRNTSKSKIGKGNAS